MAVLACFRCEKQRTGVEGFQGSGMPDEIQEENKKIRRLRHMVDFSLEYIRTQPLSHDQAMVVVQGVKRFALDLFPGKEETFEIVYAPRFRRLLNAKFKRS
jgi:hypothetical protein